MRGYLEGQARAAARLAESLGVGEEERSRNQRLSGSWDWLSLALCLDWAPASLDGRDAGSQDGVLDPWPFARDGPVEVRCEGLRLEGRYADERALHAALDAAPRVDVRFTLRQRALHEERDAPRPSRRARRGRARA